MNRQTKLLGIKTEISRVQSADFQKKLDQASPETLALVSPWAKTPMKPHRQFFAKFGLPKMDCETKNRTHKITCYPKTE